MEGFLHMVEEPASLTDERLPRSVEGLSVDDRSSHGTPSDGRALHRHILYVFHYFSIIIWFIINQNFYHY